MAAAPPAGPAFALTPARATHDVIDYTTTLGINIWTTATRKLSEELFDCTPEGLRDFLQLVEQRGNIMGWDNSVLWVPNDPAQPAGAGKEFIKNYGNRATRD